MLRLAAFAIGTTTHLFYINWIGQQIIDNSEKVFNSALVFLFYIFCFFFFFFIILILSKIKFNEFKKQLIIRIHNCSKLLLQVEQNDNHYY